MKLLRILSLTFLALSVFTRANSQARFSVGIGTGLNFPLPHGYNLGSDYFLQGDIKLTKRWALTPSIGVVNIESDKKGVYNGYYFVGSGRSVGLVYTGSSVKYYFSDLMFVTGGVSLNVGGEDAGSTGLGGHAGAGLNLNLDNHNALEFTGGIEGLPDYDKFVPLLCLRGVYKFNFGK
jgi:hypothetical protein